MLESLVVLGMVAGLATYSAWTGPTASQRRNGVVLTTVILGLIVMITGRQHGTADADVWACLMVALCLIWQWPDHRRVHRGTQKVESEADRISVPMTPNESETIHGTELSPPS